jgi:hypothetical protein
VAGRLRRPAGRRTRQSSESLEPRPAGPGPAGRGRCLLPTHWQGKGPRAQGAAHASGNEEEQEDERRMSGGRAGPEAKQGQEASSGGADSESTPLSPALGGPRRCCQYAALQVTRAPACCSESFPRFHWHLEGGRVDVASEPREGARCGGSAGGHGGEDNGAHVRAYRPALLKGCYAVTACRAASGVVPGEGGQGLLRSLKRAQAGLSVMRMNAPLQRMGLFEAHAACLSQFKIAPLTDGGDFGIKFVRTIFSHDAHSGSNYLALNCRGVNA